MYLVFSRLHHQQQHHSCAFPPPLTPTPSALHPNLALASHYGEPQILVVDAPTSRGSAPPHLSFPPSREAGYVFLATPPRPHLYLPSFFHTYSATFALFVCVGTFVCCVCASCTYVRPATLSHLSPPQLSPQPPTPLFPSPLPLPPSLSSLPPFRDRHPSPAFSSAATACVCVFVRVPFCSL